MFRKKKKQMRYGIEIRMKNCCDCYKELYNEIKDLEYTNLEYSNYNNAINDVLNKIKEKYPDCCENK